MENSAKYAYEIYLERSFSAAAKKLYLSQPALSSAISRLETNLGFSIFDRSAYPVSLTPQGRIYIESLEQIMECEALMEERIKKLSDMNFGSLTVGGVSYTSFYLLPIICEHFHKIHPEINITVDAGNGSNYYFAMHDKLKKGDIEILMSYAPVADMNNLLIQKEKVVIALRRDLPEAQKLLPYSLTRSEVLDDSKVKKKSLTDLSLLKDLPFLTFGKTSGITKMMTELLGEFKTAPHKIINVSHSELHYNLMRAGLGALFSSEMQIRTIVTKDDELIFIPIDSPVLFRSVYLVSKPKNELSPIAASFLEIAEELFKNGNPF